MKVVDASVWVSNVVPPDAMHRASREWLMEQVASGTTLWAPAFAIVEVSGAIARCSGNVAAADAAVRQLASLANLRLVPTDDPLLRAATRLPADLGLRGADAVYVATAVQLGCPLVTWDEEVIRRAGAAAGARRPDAPDA